MPHHQQLNHNPFVQPKQIEQVIGETSLQRENPQNPRQQNQQFYVQNPSAQNSFKNQQHPQQTLSSQH